MTIAAVLGVRYKECAAAAWKDVHSNSASTVVALGEGVLLDSLAWSKSALIFTLVEPVSSPVRSNYPIWLCVGIRSAVASTNPIPKFEKSSTALTVYCRPRQNTMSAVIPFSPAVSGNRV